MSAEPDWLTRAIEKARAEGRILNETAARPPAEPGPAPVARGKRNTPPPLVAFGASPTADGLMVIVPLFVAPLTNGPALKRQLIGRAARDRRATAHALARCLDILHPVAAAAQAGRPVRATLTRLAVGRMDDDNLRPALKYVRDAVALLCGVDDGPAGPIDWKYEQQRSERAGVRIILEVLPCR